ncbi:PREDICTED: WAT1-related protein At2g37460-like [Erythranthe guttata]|uniref:WAT1-related protein At2g37460-like n=1 Tax=Erythranthe guttata TaxID=4155 RepID=UPI00064D9926|nr:PREDICTED: WAT1-related protein At2g37460-like [Erythranthe guttata]|eukprot:XP_012847464.1 PREDICTED: WAT1-related protein At2g37460-like [Erythranthe guttata]
MALVHGPVLSFPWTHRGGVTPSHNHDVQQTFKGAAFIMAECFSWLSFMILHDVTLKSYPAELSLTVWICILGAFEGAIVALVMDKTNATTWGVFSSGVTYFLQGVVMKQRGPVFVTAFSPLNVIVGGLYLFVWGKKKYGDKSGLSAEDEEKNEQTENVTGQISSSV